LTSLVIAEAWVTHGFLRIFNIPEILEKLKTKLLNYLDFDYPQPGISVSRNPRTD